MNKTSSKFLIGILCVLSMHSSFAQNSAPKINEEITNDEADWDSFADELDDTATKSDAPSKVSGSKSTETATETEGPDKDFAQDALTPPVKNEESVSSTPKVAETASDQDETFDLGAEENELIQLSQVLSTQISDEEWRTITQSSTSTTYIVQKNDWLYKISKKLFGNGLYYPKIWSMNPQITNPHEIEPGTQLVFDPGSAIMPPQLSVGGAAIADNGSVVGTSRWFDEKRQLVAKGIEVISSDEELAKVMGPTSRNEEYKKYVPPEMQAVTLPPVDQYDASGIEKSSAPTTEFKQGYYLNTFITNNELKVLGEMTDMTTEAMFTFVGSKVFVTIAEGQQAQAGEVYSLFESGGKIDSKFSERQGQKFSICGAIKLLQQVDVTKRKWEAVVTEYFIPAPRGAKLTSYTPKIDKIFKTFNSRLIEGTIFSGYLDSNNTFSTGNILYIDRGRADGVEVGNVFDVYDSMDRGTGEAIATNPAYRTGELTVISITDNFATAIVSKGSMDFKVGDLIRTRSSEEENIARSQGLKKVPGVEVKEFKSQGVAEELVDKVKNTSLSAQELAELKRQQSQNDIIEESERDLKELDELENTIAEADQLLKPEASDKLATRDLEDVEGQAYQQGLKVDLDSLEEKYGKKYLDDDLQSVDNPFGLSQYDVEEVDELMNMKHPEKQQDSVGTSSSAPIRKRK